MQTLTITVLGSHRRIKRVLRGLHQQVDLTAAAAFPQKGRSAYAVAATSIQWNKQGAVFIFDSGVNGNQIRDFEGVLRQSGLTVNAVLSPVRLRPGPSAPVISFWYADHYLGETRYPFLSASPVTEARKIIAEGIELLNPGPDGQAMLRRIYSADCEARIYDGAYRRPSTTAVTLPKAQRLYLEAYATSSHVNGPLFAEYVISDYWINHLIHLSALCKENHLTECRKFDCPVWYGEDLLRLSHQELVVDDQDFYFCARPKHADFTVETHGMEIGSLVTLAREGGDIYWGSDPGALKRLITELRSNQAFSPVTIDW